MVEEDIFRAHSGEEIGYARIWARTWSTLCSAGISNLWILRNHASFLQEDVSIDHSVREDWKIGVRQLRAAASAITGEAARQSGLLPTITPERKCLTTVRAVTSGEKTRTATGFARGTGVASQA